MKKAELQQQGSIWSKMSSNQSLVKLGKKLVN